MKGTQLNATVSGEERAAPTVGPCCRVFNRNTTLSDRRMCRSAVDDVFYCIILRTLSEHDGLNPFLTLSPTQLPADLRLYPNHTPHHFSRVEMAFRPSSSALEQRWIVRNLAASISAVFQTKMGNTCHFLLLESGQPKGFDNCRCLRLTAALFAPLSHSRHRPLSATFGHYR